MPMDAHCERLALHHRGRCGADFRDLVDLGEHGPMSEVTAVATKPDVAMRP